ncbi:MAG: biotin--[acetyl-CoA-carboxylase] ligase, partial [Sphingobacteriales bacterium]
MAHQPLNIGEYSVYLQETNSSNDALKLMFGNDNLPEGAVVYTDFQTNGRGQQNNSWE